MNVIYMKKFTREKKFNCFAYVLKEIYTGLFRLIILN